MPRPNGSWDGGDNDCDCGDKKKDGDAADKKQYIYCIFQKNTILSVIVFNKSIKPYVKQAMFNLL